MEMKKFILTQAVMDADKDICAAVNKHALIISQVEMLALLSNIIGQLTSSLDGRIITPKMALEIIEKNILEGIAQTLRDAALMGEPQGSA